MRKSHEELQKEIDAAKREIKVSGIYVHYKRPETYQVLDIVWLTDIEEPTVIYKAQYGLGITFARQVSSWLQDVEVDGERRQRFTLQQA